jgi:hypothetical protein
MVPVTTCRTTSASTPWSGPEPETGPVRDCTSTGRHQYGTAPARDGNRLPPPGRPQAGVKGRCPGCVLRTSAGAIASCLTCRKGPGPKGIVSRNRPWPLLVLAMDLSSRRGPWCSRAGWPAPLAPRTFSRCRSSCPLWRNSSRRQFLLGNSPDPASSSRRALTD